jgi:hypothetical protein
MNLKVDLEPVVTKMVEVVVVFVKDKMMVAVNEEVVVLVAVASVQDKTMANKKLVDLEAVVMKMVEVVVAFVKDKMMVVVKEKVLVVVVVVDQINVSNAKKKAICRESVLTVKFYHFL